MADKTTGDLPAVEIGELPLAPDIFDDTMLPAEQQGEAVHITGAHFKGYAVAAAKEQADAAKTSADAAAKSRDEAAEKAKDAADVALHPPILKDGSDHWWTWDTGKNDYVDSGIDAGVSVQIGKTTTGPAGSAASVKNTGTNTDPVFEFTIPKGDKGDKGDKGEKGDAGPKGDTGLQGPVGPAGGMTQAEADRRYLAVAGGIVTGQVYMSAGLTLLNGGTVNGSLTLQSEPQSDSDAVNKGYVDQRLAELANTWFFTIPNMHRNIYRGKNLGDHVTEAQKAAIAAGTWDDLYVGDYWVMNKHTWRIADFDYWYKKGDQECTTHHIVVVPDGQLYVAQMRNTTSGQNEAGTEQNSTAGAYYNSDMRIKNLAQAKTLIEADFGTGSILKHRILLANATKDGYQSGGSYYNSEVDLMNEAMVYGMQHFRPSGNGAVVPYNYTTEYTQLALFQLAPFYISLLRQSWWLRDVVSAVDFALVDYHGRSYYSTSSCVLGVRPAVGITGAA